MTETRRQSQAKLLGWLLVGRAGAAADEPDTAPSALRRTLRADPVVAVALAVIALAAAFDVLALSVAQLSFLAAAADLARPVVAVLVLRAGLARILHRQERRFWNELALAFGIWFLSLSLLAFAPSGRTVELTSAILYAASFLTFVVAVERPMRRGLAAADHGATLTWSGGPVFVLGILFYFVLAQVAFDFPVANLELLAYFMYLVFDFYLTGKLVYFAKITESLRWRTLYSLLALTMLGVLSSHLLDSLVAAGAPAAPWSVLAELWWNVPYLFLVPAARLRHHPFPAAEPVFDTVARSQEALRLAEERRDAESALSKSEEKFNKASRSIPDAMLISTLAEGRLIEVNESFERQFGYSRAEALGKTGIELKLWVEPEDRAMMTRLLRQRGMVRNLEFELTKKSGEKRLTLLSGEIIDLDGEKCLLVVLRDITEKRDLEEKLRRARRLESIGTLTSAIASDLKDVLVPIWNTIRDMRRAPLEDKYEPFLADLESQARRGMEVVRQILTFSGREETDSTRGRQPAARPAEGEGRRRPGGASEPAAIDLPVGDGECVLVIGDDVSIRDLLRETLEACGYQVFSARIGNEAIELYAERRHEIDVVLLDAMKSASSGESTMKKLLALDPGVAVIAVNGSTEAPGPENVRILLEKPYTAEKLLTSLKRVLT